MKQKYPKIDDSRNWFSYGSKKGTKPSIFYMAWGKYV